MAQSVGRPGICFSAWISDFSLLQNIQTDLGAPPATRSWDPVLSPHEIGNLGVKLTTYLRLELSVTISGAIPSLPPTPYAFLAYPRTALYFTCNARQICVFIKQQIL